MISARTDLGPLAHGADAPRSADAAEWRHEQWAHWPVNWTAVWVGTLTAFAVALLIGLIGVALGAHVLGPEGRVVDWHKFGIGALILSVCGAFFAFAAGGWACGKIAGILRAEPAILHGAVVWALSVPLFVAAAALGAGSFLGGWYAGLSGTPAWANAAQTPFVAPLAPGANATAEELTAYRQAEAEYRVKLQQWREDTPRATRNSALGALTALLIGLIGSVVGGWLACGEPMTFTYHRTRQNLASRTA